MAVALQKISFIILVLGCRRLILNNLWRQQSGLKWPRKFNLKHDEASMWPEKSLQNLKKLHKMISLQKWNILTHLIKMPKIWAIWVKYVLPRALKSCLKCNKSPNLVTLLGISISWFNISCGLFCKRQKATYLQCDQMVIVLIQYLVIYSNEHLLNTIIIAKEGYFLPNMKETMQNCENF